MKLLIRGDDFGFTPAVTYGIIDCIENGTLTCTGLFTNMPSSLSAAKLIPKYPQTCFGLDFNITSGPCVADPELIPHLIDADGNFIRSNVKYADPLFQTMEGREILWPKEEVKIELLAQYDKYLELVGKKPEYLNRHSLGLNVPTYLSAIEEISEMYDVPYCHNLESKYGFERFKPIKAASSTEKKFDYEKQMQTDRFERLRQQGPHLLTCEYVCDSGHPGYVDDELMRFSSLSIRRAKEASYLLSQEYKEWIISNRVELISYRDLQS